MILKSKHKKRLSILMATAILFSSISISVFAQNTSSGVLDSTVTLQQYQYPTETRGLSDGLSDFIIENGVLTKYKGIGGDVTIPDSVTSIASNAFSDSNSITAITIPDKVTSIGNRSFQGCGNLISVSIGSGVSTVGEAPFMYCLKLQEINVSSNNPSITSLAGVLFNKDMTKLLAFPNGKSGSYTIPDGVETLANRAFCWSTELTSLKIPDSITTLEYYSLALCEKLSFVEFDGDCAGLTSIRDVFNQSNNIDTLTIGKNVSDLDGGQFAFNTKLSHIKIHTENQNFSTEDEILFNKEKSKLILSAKTISGEYQVPIGVIEIQPAAFSNCTGLTDIYIPSQTTKIGDPTAYHSVFGNCGNLTIHGDEGSAAQQYARDKGIPFVIGNGTPIVTVTWLQIGRPVAEVTVGQNVQFTALISPDNATDKSVTWESSKTSIAMVDGDGLVNCVGVGEVIITVRTKNGEFSDSTNLTVYSKDDFVIVGGVLTAYKGLGRDIVIPDEVISIGEYAFSNCSNLTSVTIPDSVTNIASNAFYFCMFLTSMTIPDSVISLGEQAFQGCVSLTTIEVGSENTAYSSMDGILYNKLKTELIRYPTRKEGLLFTIPDSVTSIDNYAFYDCRILQSVTIPDSVTSIGISAFSFCYNLTSVIIPSSVTSISNNMFQGSTKLTSVTIPDSVTSIGESAFLQCYSLTSVTIPDKVTSIGRSAFAACELLKSVTIPDSVISLGEQAFQGCVSLTTIEVGSENTVYSSMNGILYNKLMTTLISYPEGKVDTLFTVPRSVTIIGELAFRNCIALTSVTIPDSVISLGVAAFMGCTNLTQLTIPESVTSIPYYMFNGCTNLTRVTIPKSVSFIQSSAFDACPNLTIYGVTPSYAETYAQQKGIPFIALNGETSEKSLVPVTGLTISKSTHTFNGIEKPIYIKATLTPSNATKQSMKILSSNEKVAIAKLETIFNGTGFESQIKVEPIGLGSCNITIENEGKIAICRITVKRVEFFNDEKLLKKMALSNIVYHDELLRSDNKDKYVKNIGIQNYGGTMFEVEGEDIKWREFWDKYIGFYKVIGTINLPYGLQAVAFEDENKDIVISFRGTKGAQDTWEGFLYTIMNLNSVQYSDAYNFYKNIKITYPGRDISLTGHSLGGALAANVSILDGEVKADVFNDATGWILWNTYVDNTTKIQKFDGVNVTKHTSYVNMDNSYELSWGQPLSRNNFNVFTAWEFLEYRNRYEMMTNNHSMNDGTIHGIPAMIKYYPIDKSYDLSRCLPLYQTWEMKAAKTPWGVTQRGARVLLGTDGNDTLVPDSFLGYQYIIYTGNGNDEVCGRSTSGDSLVAIGKGTKDLNGKAGNDTYIIDKNLNEGDIHIVDPSGNDTLIVKGVHGSETFNIYEDYSGNYYFDLNDNCRVFVQKERHSSSGPLTIKTMDSEGNIQNTMKFELSNSSYVMSRQALSTETLAPKSLRLNGVVEVAVYDQNNNLLGTHDNTQNNIIPTNYAYFYSTNNETEKYLDIDLINGDYTLKITSKGNVDYVINDPDAQGSIFYEQKGIDLSNGSILVINSDFLNSENKFALEKDSVITPLIAAEFVDAAQVNIAQTEVTIQAGTIQIVSATTAPDNALEKGVTWSVIQPSEDLVVAGVLTDGNGETTVIGVSEGTAILRATAIGATDVYQEIPITVSQADAPPVSTGSYIQGSYTDIEAIIVSGTIPSGFDELYFMENNGGAVNANSIEVINEGITTVKVRARNSSSGEISKEAVVTVKIDRTEPVILGVQNRDEYYIDRLVAVKDLNLEKVTINGTTDFTGEELVRGKWFSEVGDYTIVAKDLSGKETTVSFKLKAMPAAADITSQSLALNNTIRYEFEEIKYELTEERRNVLEAQISALETQWVISTGVWSVASLESESGMVTVKVVNRLNEYAELPTLLLAGYDETNKLLFIETKNIEEGVTDYTFNTAGITSAKKLKAFLWKDIMSLIPVADNLEQVVPLAEGEDNTVSLYLGTPQTILNTDGTFTTRGSDVAFANKPMTLIVYKGSELTVENVEYLDQVTADSYGAYSFNNYRTKEDSTQLTGNFTVNVGGELIDTPLLAGIMAPIGIFSATPIVQIGINPNAEDSAGLFVGIMDIKDAEGNGVPEAKLADYQIELVYDHNLTKVFDVIDESNLGQIALDNAPNSIKVSVMDIVDPGTSTYERLFFVPLALTGISNNTTDVTIKFTSLNDQNLNFIGIPDVRLTFQRGKILNETNNGIPSIADAIAGLQYLAEIVDSGTDTGKVNVINMASILPPEAAAIGIKPSVKNVIALMQYILEIRNDSFQIVAEGF